MTMTTFPQTAVKFEIQTYKKPRNLSELKKTHVPFSGSPKRHPLDSEKVILVIDPYSTHTFYYEFKASDITYAEELSNLVNLEGEVVAIVRIWVKKKSIGIRCAPFLVEDTSAAMIR